jgi:uncharacterized protein (TIGR03067 family)
MLTLTIGLIAFTGVTTGSAEKPASHAHRMSQVCLPLQHGVRTGWLYVRVQVNGRPATLMVDSGAAVCVLTPSAAGRLGLPISPIIGSVQWPFGSRVGRHKAVQTAMQIGSGNPLTLLFSVYDPAVPFDAAFVAMDRVSGCDGLLGAPAMAHLSASIDYRTRRLYTSDGWSATRGLLGVWQSETVKFAGEDAAEPSTNGRLKLTADGLDWSHPMGERRGSWLHDAGGSLRIMNWQVEDEATGGYTQAVIYRLDGDRLTVAGRLLRDVTTKDYRPVSFAPADVAPFNVVTFRRVREAAPPPRPAP